jgi:hypothetical protein
MHVIILFYDINLLHELYGFLAWIARLLILAAISYLVYSKSDAEGSKPRIPDKAFDYTYRPSFLPEDGYYIDLHSHTLASDGAMTPEQNIRWHIANGYNAFVVTDHNTGKNNRASLDFQAKYPQILVIPGFEWTTFRVHLNFLGIEDFPHRVPIVPMDEQIEEAIREAKALDAIVVVDHVTWTINQPPLRAHEYTHPTREQLFDWGCDGIEYNNEMFWYDRGAETLLESLGHEWKGRPIFEGTGTDVHNPYREWAACWTQVLLTPEEREAPPSFETVKKALLEARTKVWVEPEQRKPHEQAFQSKAGAGPLATAFAPFIGIVAGARIAATSKLRIASYLIWLLVAYVPVRLLFFFVGIG